MIYCEYVWPSKQDKKTKKKKNRKTEKKDEKMKRKDNVCALFTH